MRVLMCNPEERLFGQLDELFGSPLTDLEVATTTLPAQHSYRHFFDSDGPLHGPNHLDTLERLPLPPRTSGRVTGLLPCHQALEDRHRRRRRFPVLSQQETHESPRGQRREYPWFSGFSKSGVRAISTAAQPKTRRFAVASEAVSQGDAVTGGGGSNSANKNAKK